MLRAHRVPVPIVLIVLTLTASLAYADPPSQHLSWCGADPARWAADLARHHDAQRRGKLTRHAESQAGDVFQFDQIAVIEDDGTMVYDAHPFDLSGRSIQFLRRPKGTSVVRSHLGFKDLIGDRLDLDDDGSVEIVFPEGFRFPFFDDVYDRVWVNANGSVTFGGPSPTTPYVPELLIGLPRIAPLWVDFDPTSATGRGGVYVTFIPGRLRVTWLELPETVTGAISTVQLTLFTTGRAVAAYGDVGAGEAIVGLSPGGLAADARFVDYQEELPLPPRPGAIVQTFDSGTTINDLAIAQAFFEHFQDRYDHLIVWLDFPANLGARSTAYATPVRNQVRGIGLPEIDVADVIGAERLQAYVQMGHLGKYSDDPDLATFGTYSAMDILGHEFGHRWLVHARFLEDGTVSADLLGRDRDHWSFYADTDASLMEGNELRDNGDGSFTTIEATARFSLLDQYLMGLVPAGEVPPFYYVRATDGPGREANPAIGVTFRGERVDLSVHDLIDVLGPREPSASESQKLFKTAFVLIGRQGETVSQESLEKLNQFRRRWVSYFQEITDGRGQVGTAMRPR